MSCSLSGAPGSSRLSPTAHSSGGMGRRLGRPGAMARASLPFLLLLAALCSRGQQPQPPPGSGESDESGSPEVTAVRASLGGRGVGGGRGNGERDG